MVSLTLCPECQKPVLVPEGVPESAEVQCPLCEADFTLADSIPDDAPRLVVISVPAGAATSAAVIDPTDSEIESPDEELVGPDAFQFSFDDASSDGDDLALTPMEAATADEDQPDDDRSEDDQADEESSDEAEHESATVRFESDENAGTISATAARARPSKGVGWKGQLVGIVVFGIVGLGLGYGILKMVKPAAAEPIDQILASAWTSVSALWGGDGTPAADGTPAVDGGPVRDTAQSNRDPSGFPEPGEFLREPGAHSNTQDGTQDPASGPADAGSGLDGEDGDGAGRHVTLKANESTVIGAAAHPYRALLQVIPQKAAALGQVTADQLLVAVADAQVEAEKAEGAVKAAAYFGLCDVGEKLAMADPGDSDVVAHRAAADALVRQLGTPENRSSLSAYSYQWLFLDSSKSPLDQRVGVFLVGQVQRVVPYGPLFATSIKVAKGADTKTVVVITPKRPGFHVHNMAAVLGSVVRNPSGALPEFGTLDALPEADRSLMILSGTAIRLPDAPSGS